MANFRRASKKSADGKRSWPHASIFDLQEISIFLGEMIRNAFRNGFRNGYIMVA